MLEGHGGWAFYSRLSDLVPRDPLPGKQTVCSLKEPNIYLTLGGGGTVSRSQPWKRKIGLGTTTPTSGEILLNSKLRCYSPIWATIKTRVDEGY